MLKIVKKASNKQASCDLTNVISASLVKKDESCVIHATPVYKRLECGLSAFICGNGEMRKVS